MADVPSTPADGNIKVVWVPAVTDPDNPTATELDAGVDISCYITGDGFAPGLDEQTVSDPRLCDTQDYERPGRFTRNLSLTYVDNPDDEANNVAYDTLVPGTKGSFAVRRGMAWDTPIAADHKVDLWPVTCGQYDDQPPEANSVLRVTQRMFVTSRVRQRVAVAAGT